MQRFGALLQAIGESGWMTYFVFLFTLYGFVFFAWYLNAPLDELPTRFWIIWWGTLQVLAILSVTLSLSFRSQIEYLTELVTALLGVAGLVIGFAIIYRKLGIIGQNGALVQNSYECAYFSVITWTTVGYGDFVPSPDSRMWAASEAFLGYFVMIALISIVAKFGRITPA